MPSIAYETGNDLPIDVRFQVIDLLNRRLADVIDLSTQVKQAHWNVKGPNFIALHLLFDQIHGEVLGYVDTIAERVVQLGGIAGGTARMVAEASSISEYPHTASTGAEHVGALAGALAEFGAKIRRTSDEASDLFDQNSADICTEVSRGIDKWLWFVEAHAQERTLNVPVPPRVRDHRRGLSIRHGASRSK